MTTNKTHESQRQALMDATESLAIAILLSTDKEGKHIIVPINLQELFQGVCKVFSKNGGEVNGQKY